MISRKIRGFILAIKAMGEPTPADAANVFLMGYNTAKGTAAARRAETMGNLEAKARIQKYKRSVKENKGRKLEVLTPSTMEATAAKQIPKAAAL